MSVKVKQRLFDIDGVEATVKFSKRNTSRYQTLVAGMNSLLELAKYGNDEAMMHIVRQIDEVTAREAEAREISLTLNGAGHASLSPEEQHRLVTRHRELKNYFPSTPTA